MIEIAAGDIDKIGLLYERYNKLLFGYFYKLTRSQDVSEDLVNDVFLKILDSKNKYRGDGIFRVWMFRIARNIFIDHYNKSKKMMAKELFVLNDRNEGNTEDVHEVYEKKENKELVHNALMQLKEKEREVLVLCKLDGLKYREVAKILDCTEEAVKVRAFRALQNLKSTLLKMKN